VRDFRHFSAPAEAKHIKITHGGIERKTGAAEGKGGGASEKA
jgi:hypothetical protein